MKSKKQNDQNLKAIGLDGTWIPRGHFGEKDFTCSKGHVLIHHIDVRSPHMIAIKKGKSIPRNVKQDILSIHDDIVKYSVDISTGKVTFACPIDGEILATYTPHEAYKNFDGELSTSHDGRLI